MTESKVKIKKTEENTVTVRATLSGPRPCFRQNVRDPCMLELCGEILQAAGLFPLDVVELTAVNNQIVIRKLAAAKPLVPEFIRDREVPPMLTAIFSLSRNAKRPGPEEEESLFDEDEGDEDKPSLEDL